MSRNRRFTGDKSPSDVNRGLSDRLTSDRLFPNYTNEQKPTEIPSPDIQHQQRLKDF